MDSLKITLAGKEYSVRQLTLRQGRALGIGVLREQPASPDAAFSASVDQSIEILATALARDYPEMTADALLNLEIDVREARAAADQVLVYAGFLKAAPDAPPGEAVPGAA